MSKKLICLISFVLVLGATSNASAELVAYWTFDEGSGTTAYDSSGSGHDGTLEGNPEWADGKLDGALQLDGSGDYVSCGLIDIDTTLTGGLTVCAWINKPPGGDMKFCSNRQGDNSAGGGFTCTIYNDRMEMDFTNATARNLNRDTDGPTVPANTWVHVAWVYDDVANTFNEYHDGVLADSSTENVSVGISTQEFRIGADAPGLGRYVNGLLDDLRIYDYALSEQEILGVMQGGGVSYPFASRPSPADGALHADTWVSLSWQPGGSAVSHDVYLGDNFDDVNDGLGDTFRGNQGLDSLYFVAGFIGYPYPDGLVNGTTYYWRIDEVNEADPNSPWKGDIWSFSIPSKKAYEPAPANGAKFIDSAVTLSWTAGFGAKLHYVYFGEDYDTVANATEGPSQVFTEYSPGTLELDKTYYWRVDEFEGPATHTGDVWSFRTMPDIPITDPNLVAWWTLDEGSGNTALDWSGHGNHAVIGGTPDFAPGYDGDALDFDGSTDYIDIDDLVAEGTFTYTMWLKPRDIPYASGFYAVLHDDQWNSGSCHVHVRNTTSQFNWSVNSGPDLLSTTVMRADLWYHVAVTIDATVNGQGQLYINGVLEDTQPGVTATAYLGPLNFGAWTNNQRYYHGLMDDIRIYDRVLTADEIKETMRGDPLVAWDPSPANGSTPDIDSVLPLAWSPGDKASQHDVYFGTDKTVVEDTDTSDTGGTYRGLQSGTSYTPPEGIEWGGGPYYWRIDENNNDGTVNKGRVWTFTVADFVLVDDFESYDAGDNQIWYAWHDGLGYGVLGTDPYFAGNGTGAAVGDETTASYTEETIVNSGGQSMPLSYDNNKQGYSK
ncbi:MAG TPA: LamG domain-containing protein, partial [Sedimentisphaerales bacterium]|nr:LamG domain-containing protein [Sedimentisphaerales bacterium]